MVQMVGVVIFTLGIPRTFEAIEEGHFDNTVIVIGYVIMRGAMLCQWVRAYRSDPEHRRAIATYMATLVVAQILWVATTFLEGMHLPLPAIFTLTTLVTCVELTGPLIAERGKGTPWHAHHVAERHGLLTIITIGEIVTGTVLTLEEILGDAERTIDWGSAILVALSGIAMAVGMWWSYFITPFGKVLHRFLSRSFGFGYAHFLVWPSLAAVVGGLHVVALSFEKTGSHVDHTVAALALAVPVGLYTVALYLAHYLTTRSWAGLHTFILLATLAVLAGAVLLSTQHVSLPVVLLVVTVVPWITVAAFELYCGAAHEAMVLEGLYEHDRRQADGRRMARALHNPGNRLSDAAPSTYADAMANVETTITGGIAHVKLNRPDKLNGLTLPMLGELVAAAHHVRTNKAVRVVVVSGEGRSFCAGLDFGSVNKAPAKIIPAFIPRPWRGTNTFQEACWAWRRVPVPVIAAVHGHCYGGGLQIALGADYRYTTPDAEWSVLEGKWGLIPDMSGVQSLKELVGIDVAKKLTMTAEMFSGERAVALGLASEVRGDPLASAMELAQDLTTKSPDQLAAAKRLFNRSWNASARTTFRRERAEQLVLLVSQNTAKARKAAFAKAGARAEARAAVKYSPRVLP